jgi:hypothetical protein
MKMMTTAPTTGKGMKELIQHPTTTVSACLQGGYRVVTKLENATRETGATTTTTTKMRNTTMGSSLAFFVRKVFLLVSWPLPHAKHETGVGLIFLVLVMYPSIVRT